MPKVKSEFSVNANATGVSQTAATANTETRIMRWTVPRSAKFLIRPTDIFWLSANSASTESAGSARVRLLHSDPSVVVSKVLVDELYTALNASPVNRDTMYTLGTPDLLKPDELLDIMYTGDVALTTAATRFRITMLREAEVIAL